MFINQCLFNTNINVLLKNNVRPTNHDARAIHLQKKPHLNNIPGLHSTMLTIRKLLKTSYKTEYKPEHEWVYQINI